MLAYRLLPVREPTRCTFAAMPLSLSTFAAGIAARVGIAGAGAGSGGASFTGAGFSVAGPFLKAVLILF